VRTAGEDGKSPTQVSLAWLLHDPRVTAVIVGARRPEQLRENLAAGDWDLPEALWARLDEAARYDLGYPKVWMDSTFPATFGEEEF
jgi:aryl-alcohol dehydrogenase-like predicted oxidoreductase